MRLFERVLVNYMDCEFRGVRLLGRLYIKSPFLEGMGVLRGWVRVHRPELAEVKPLPREQA